MFTDPNTGEQRNGIAEVRYTHEAAIQRIVAQPGITQRELAREFGVTEVWMSQVVRSDAFQARLAEVREQVYGPALASIREKIEAASAASWDKILDKLVGPAAMPTDDFVLKAAQISATALGYGARPAEGGKSSTNVQVIVQVPAKAASESDWASRYPGGIPKADVIEAGTPTPPQE